MYRPPKHFMNTSKRASFDQPVLLMAKKMAVHVSMKKGRKALGKSTQLQKKENGRFRILNVHLIEGKLNVNQLM